MKNLMSTAIAIIGLAVPLFAQDLPAYVPSEGLVGWWPFNGNANDESGNGNNGTVNGPALTTDRFGNSNKAYSFNGTNNYIDCGPLSAIPNTVGDITQSAWILAPNDQSAYCKMAIMSKRQLINQGWPTIGGGANGAAGFPVNNQAYFFLNAQNYSAGVTNAMTSTGLTNDGNWHLVTGTKNGSTYKLYFDGILQATLTDNFTLTSNSNLIIGHEAMWGFECEKWFAGKLDDIGIWNRALTQQEITDLYNSCQLSINTQPTNQPINVNNNAQFLVSSSDPSATYQWQTDLGVGFQNINDVGQYTGATSSTLTVSNVSLTNNNQPFRCIVTSGACSDTSDVAVLTVVDGGLCSGEVVYGCEYLTACNYNAEATVGDGSCIFPEPNYDCEGNCLLDANMNGICDQLETVGPTYCGEGTIWDAALNLCIGFNDCLADFDNSGAVDVADILVFLSLFGNVCD